MTFWDVASGRPSDLEPIKDPVVNDSMVEPILYFAGSVILAAGSILLFRNGNISTSVLGRGLYSSHRAGREGVSGMQSAVSELERTRQENENKRIEQAIRYYERALKANPMNATILKKLAISYVACGRLEDAGARLDDAINASPSDHEPWMAKATLCALRDDELGTIAALKRAAELQPGDPDCWANLGMAYKQVNDIEHARECWTAVTQLSPATAEAWVNRAELAYSIGDVDEGVRAWKEACRLNDKLVSRWVSTFDLGMQAVAMGDDARAAKYFDEAIGLNPSFAAPWSGKAILEKRRLEFDAALKFVDEALRREPDRAQYWLDRGSILQAAGRRDEADECWKRAFTLDPSLPVPWVVEYEDGCRYMAANQMHDALRYFTRAIELYPEFTEAWFRKGVAYRPLGYTKDARACFARVLELNPDHVVAAMNLANVEYVDGNHEKAFALWDRAMELDSSMGQAPMNKGAALADSGELDEAERLFSKAAAAGHPSAAKALSLCRLYKNMDPAVGPRQ